MKDSFQSSEERLAELERAASYQKMAEDLTWRGPRFRRWRSKSHLFGIPLVEIATGPDIARGEFRGHARGIIAIGDIATGVFAMGGVARGIFAFGGVAIGLVTFGGCSIGLLTAIGGAAVSMGLAMGGAAVGAIAIGGAALGVFAIGGAAFGVHAISGVSQDPELVHLLQQWFR